MKRFFLLLLPLLASCGGTQTNDPWGNIDPDKAARQAKVVELSMKSTSMNRTMTYTVWLPAQYDEKNTYPFLYLLHGYEYGDQSRLDRCWLDKGNAAKLAEDYQKAGGVAMVIVMPNGLDKFYMNDGYETYFEQELMAEVETRYHCNGKRAVAGLSMGGFGTLYHSLKYPSKFKYAYAMSPAAKMWGTDPKDFIGLQKDKSVFPSFTIEVGTEDMTVNNNDSKALYNAMVKEGIRCEWIERAGTHDWPFWMDCLPKALIKAGDSFK